MRGALARVIESGLLAAALVARPVALDAAPTNDCDLSFEHPANIHNVCDVRGSRGEGWRGWLASLLPSLKVPSRSYALVVGLSDYQGDWTPLEAPRHDAMKVSRFLIERAEFDYVVTLTDEEATGRNIAHYMVDVLPEAVAANDRLVFYYSGHGTQRYLPDGGVRGYLPMRESRHASWSSMVSMKTLEDWYGNLRHARHVLFALDACFSGLAGVQSKRDPRDLLVDDLSKRGHFLITAGAQDQTSFASMEEWGGSLFTQALLEGLDGEADLRGPNRPADGVVSLTEVFEYIRLRLNHAEARYPKIQQTPLRSDLLQGESLGEFFVQLTEFAAELKATPTDPSTQSATVEEKSMTSPKSGLLATRDIAPGEPLTEGAFRSVAIEESVDAPSDFASQVAGACLLNSVKAGAQLQWADLEFDCRPPGPAPAARPDKPQRLRGIYAAVAIPAGASIKADKVDVIEGEDSALDGPTDFEGEVEGTCAATALAAGERLLWSHLAFACDNEN